MNVKAHSETLQGFFSVEEYDLSYKKFDGSHSEVVTRGALISSDAVIVLPYDPVSDRVLLVEQFRTGPYVNGDTNNLCVIEGDNVSLSYSTDVGWFITDSNGIQIQSFFSAPGTNSLTLTNLSSGLYNIEVFSYNPNAPPWLQWQPRKYYQFRNNP